MEQLPNFADDGTGISYQAIDFAYDDTLIFNDVTVNRVGGAARRCRIRAA